MVSSLIEKLQKGRPVSFTREEEEVLTESLREAMANTLELPVAAVPNDAKILHALGVDSIDVCAILAQLCENL